MMNLWLNFTFLISFTAFFVMKANSQDLLSCRSYGRDAVLKGADEQGKSRKWAKCSNGKWETLEGRNIANDSQSDVASFAQQFASKSCCDLNCRATVVPSDQLQRAPFTSVVYIELYTEHNVIYCSGSVVAERVVLTSSACLRDTDDEPILGGIVKGLYKSPGNASVTVNIKRWRYFVSCSPLYTGSYGVILLDWSPKFPIMPLASYSDQTAEQQLAIIGFSFIAGIPTGQMVVDTKKQTIGTLYNYLSAQLIGGSGGIGSPIIAVGVGQIAVFTYFGVPGSMTCLANDQFVFGPSVWGKPFNATHLVKTVQ